MKIKKYVHPNPENTIEYEKNEWIKISKSMLKPEDYGYLSLFLSITQNMSCDKANIVIRGKRNLF